MTEPAPPPNVDFEGVWENRLGSQMELSVAGNTVSGTYRTNVGAPAPTEEFDLTGFVTGDLITFTVNFGKFGSLTAWAGQHTQPRPGEFEIKTLWHLARNIEDAKEPSDLWSGIWAGANTYVRPSP
jgi:Avidin family